MMLVCMCCGKELPNSPRHNPTSKMATNAMCSALCKIKHQLITIDPDGCWIYGRPAFTWSNRSHSIRGIVYLHYFNHNRPADLIVMTCKRNNCTNPEHMVSFRRRP
jgi:hypothetical protein